MNTIQLIQGSPKWMAHRATHFNASDAPAMMGCSPYKTRAQLLHEMHTGLTADINPATQRIFDNGHRFEALARPLAEKILAEELYPVVGTSGKLSASFDGLNMAEDVAFEHKTLNDDLRAAIRQKSGNANDFLAPAYRIQMEQQLMVSGAEKVLFMASKWEGETLVEERHCWYTSDPALRASIRAGWDQFDADLAAYVPPAHSAVEKVIAEAVEALPAPVVTVTGQLTLQDNFKVFEARLREFLDHKLIRQPKTDQDFSDLDAQIKAMKQAEAALDAAEGQMLAQISSVDQAKKTKDMLSKLVRENRLMAEKLLTAEKERRKGEIVAGGIAACKMHFDALNARLGTPYMPAVPADFAGAIRGLKSLSSMEEKVDAEINRVKIECSRIADGIEANLKFLRENAADYKALFADTAQLVLKPADDFQALVRGRIAEHQATVQRQAEAAAEKAREAIRAEEQAKAEAAARLIVAQELEPAAKSRDAANAEIAVATQPARQNAPKTGQDEFDNWRQGGTPEQANVVPILAVRPAPVAQPTAQPTLKLGDIADRLGFALTADFLKTLGFEVSATVKGAKLYHQGEFTYICQALVHRINQAQTKEVA